MAAEPVPASSDVLLDVRDLAVAYRDREGKEVRLIDGVTLQLKRGEALGLAGESSSASSRPTSTGPRARSTSPRPGA